uniref:ATP synthase subunit a n=1 Tax=Chiropterargas boueti TaxID=1827022 RepID=A0A1P8AG72_9ACAR|nr:ATP synthase F0 subunit 6 [Chiropterargas boueti]AMX74109.1 ATP synthase F0 subunit 6 [Chiropterargas boueti]
MMINMFSIFDPSTSSNFSLNWVVILFIFFLIPMNYWMIPSRYNMSFYLITKFISNNTQNMMSKENKKLILPIISLFWYIMLLNLSGLNPYIFTITTQINMTSILSISLWMTIMLYMWINKTNLMFAHLVPNGTPSLLANFMVLIETTSNLIRPITLCVRLTANMISGHLLLFLLSNMISLNPIMLSISMPVMMIMLSLEIAVAMIQSYVFMLLITLYMNE